MNIRKKLEFKNETYLIAYKLLYDVLFLSLISFAGLLLAEGVLPGLVTQHVSFAKVIFTIFVIIFSIVSIGKKFEITYEQPKIKRNKILPLLIIFIFLLIGNSLLKFALWENITITITTLVIFYLFFDLFFNEQKK